MLIGLSEYDFSRFQRGRRDKIADCNVFLFSGFYDFRSFFF